MKFEDDIIRGKTGERYVHYMLSHSDKIKGVWDVSEDVKYQNSDVDFLVYTTKNTVYGVEVKTDFKAHETGNIFFEVETAGNIGCLAKTKADFIYYYLYHTKKLYVIITEKLRWFIEQKGPLLELVKGGDNARGYLIPIEELIRYGIATERS